jgi:Xaa-Pro aminopeptidase
MQHAPRLQKLRALLRALPRSAGVSALLVSRPADVRYLSGFTGSNGLLLLLPRRTVLLTDSRYTQQASAETHASGARVVIASQLYQRACELALSAQVAQLLYDSTELTVATLTLLQSALLANKPGGTPKAAWLRFLAPLDPWPVPQLRAIKDAAELRLMQSAATLGCRVFAGTPEFAVAAELEYCARRLGAEAMSFSTIIASGKRSALPHGLAGPQPLPRKGFVTIDFGVVLEGYCSDMTRTVYLGKPTREEQAAYAGVLAAQLAGVAAVRAGVSAAEVDAACRDLLRARSLDQYFSHSTGHGVGLEIHEGPRLGRNVQDTLQQGMVVTIEPGVYIPGRFGIRIEDMVVVEPSGGRVLTPTPKQLLTL